MMFISLNILLSAISGIGSELMVNRNGLRHQLAAEQLDKKLDAAPNLILYEDQIAECNRLKEDIQRPEGDPLRRAAYTEAYGSFSPEPPENLLSIPDSELKVCHLVHKKSIEVKTETERLNAQQRRRSQLGNDIAFLKAQFPDTYEVYFTEEGDIISGAEEFRLAFDSFFGKLITRDYSDVGQLGFAFFMFSLSVVTSAGACLLIIGHVLRQDTARSHRPAAKAKAAITAHHSYIKRAIFNGRTSLGPINLQSKRRNNVVNHPSAAPPSQTVSEPNNARTDSQAKKRTPQSLSRPQSTPWKRTYRPMK